MFFFFSCYCDHRVLHVLTPSFPTRRSSDLSIAILAATRGRRPMFGAAARKDKAMIDIRKFDSLGHADHGWLDARHHFSFAGYHDPDRVGWGALRVWNDDAIAAQSGFPPHPHQLGRAHV